MSTALLFPGQGSQRVGMGRDLIREFATARAVFEEADEALGFSISEICFEGPEDRLALTELTQPAVVTNSIAVFRTLQAEHEFVFDVAAGHSLGEFSALVAVGALDFADAVRLVHLRGKAMQEAVPPGQGSMAALMGTELEVVQALCDEVREEQICVPANLNGAAQIVISGHAEAVQRAVAAAKSKGIRRAVMLNVSVPLHCPLMAPAAQRLAEALVDIEIHELAAPVVTNVEALPNRDAGRVKQLLIDQVTSTVKWEQSVRKMAEMGVTRAFELGSGSVLRGLVRRIAREIGVSTIGDPQEVRDWSN